MHRHATGPDASLPLVFCTNYLLPHALRPQAALDVLLFVREAIVKLVNLRSVIIEKLLEQFPSIKNAK